MAILLQRERIMALSKAHEPLRGFAWPAADQVANKLFKMDDFKSAPIFDDASEIAAKTTV